MITAEIRQSSDGIQIVVPIYRGTRLIAVLAGPEVSVLGRLPDFRVKPENVQGLTPGLRELWGVRREETIRL